MKGIPREKQIQLIEIANDGREIINDTIDRQGRKIIFKDRYGGNDNETEENGREAETIEMESETE